MKLPSLPKGALRFSFLTLIFTPLVTANTEKTIFLGPPKVNIPSSHPSLSSLLIDTLTPNPPTSSIIRTQLNASFPQNSPYLASVPAYYLYRDELYGNGKDHKLGTPSWFILDNLVPGQRYEARVCWAATQPTTFRLETFTVDTVFDTPELISSLSAFSYSSHARAVKSGDANAVHPSKERASTDTETKRSVLFLRIYAAADYFSLDKALLINVPPVRVDVILDPFLLNVLPRSLLPIVGYLIIVAIGSWFLAQWVTRTIRRVALQPEQDKKTQ